MKLNIFSRVAGSVLVTCVLITALPAPVEAQPSGGGPFGLGIILGDPSGITGKVFFSSEHAVDFHGAWDFEHESFALYADYLFHFDVFNIRSGNFELPLYVGPGGKLVFDDHHHNHSHFHRDGEISFTVRVPVGIAFLFQGAPVEVFLELVPGMRLIPNTDFDFDAALGARYYF